MSDKDEPVENGDALPKPKDRKEFAKLPGLTRRQTYRFVSLIPIIQLAICFILLFLTWTQWYKVSHEWIVDVAEASLLSCVSLWYLKRLAGFCKGHEFAIYSLIALNLLNILNSILNFDYYILYGLIVTISGLVLSGILNKK